MALEAVTLPLFITFICTLALLKFIIQRRSHGKLPPLPPSPPADPIIGHLRYIPTENPELKFTEWSKTYGDVLYLKVPNRQIIVLNSAEAAADLLEKRSGNYSDRPEFPIFDLMGWGNAMPFLRYGKKFQENRQMFQEYLGNTKVAGYSDMQILQAKQLVIEFVEGKKDKEDILQKLGTAIVVRIGFGHDMFREADPVYDTLATKHKYTISHCGPVGATPVDLFPFLRFFPSWFPGTLYANRARSFVSFVRKVHDYPVEKIRQQLEAGTAKSSFLQHHMNLLQQEGKDEIHEDFEIIKAAAGTIFAAGSDSLWSTLSVFLLAMVLHPECQVKAQEELDRVLGNPLQRLPDFGDRQSLPFVNCIVQETYRWVAVTPLAVPHRASENDVYNGMFIPKGSIVSANVWAISRDERVYRDAIYFQSFSVLTNVRGRIRRTLGSWNIWLWKTKMSRPLSCRFKLLDCCCNNAHAI